MNRNTGPFVMKPKPYKPKVATATVKSESCILLYSKHCDPLDLCDLDNVLDRRIYSQLQVNEELNESINFYNRNSEFRPPSTRPSNPLVCTY